MHSQRSAIFALTLFLSAGITASAQSTAITLSFTGTGNGSSAGFLLNGTGTFTPLGSTRIQVNGTPVGASTSLSFEFFVQDNSTLAAEATVASAPKFFTDDGAPLAIPIGPPGAPPTSTSSAVDQTVAAGATLLLQSAAPLSDPAPTIGSAQLTTNGNVGGFVIFRYNPNGQEAVVPLESRNSSAYILGFDNTAETSTGVAINSVSTQAVNIPVVVRNDTGAPIATDTITLAASGHWAFALGTDKYPVTNGIRGTIEFDAPAGAQIGALGIRTAIAHTFTTLPALVS